MKKRRKHIFWDYTYDGIYPERYTREDKRYWNKWIRRNGKSEIENDIADSHYPLPLHRLGVGFFVLGFLFGVMMR